ncbi:MAG TPA: DUF2207 domain-containing protein [Clostridiales bacterium]|nr:DUF2207 domain-containing protein [Clostridiales bacterium]
MLHRKIINKYITAGLIAVLIGSLLSAISPVYADVGIEGISAEFTVNVSPDGSVRIKENRNYLFSGDECTRIGRFYDLSKYEPNNISVFLDSQPCPVYGEESDKIPGTASVFEDGGYLFVDVYMSKQDENGTVTIEYHADNFAELHTDCAEINLSAIANECTGFESVSINIFLPPGARSDDIIIWPHGPSGTKVIKFSGSEIGIKAENISINDSIEPRILTPVSLFGGGRSVPGDFIEKIKEEEAKYVYPSGNKTTDSIFSLLTPLIAVTVLLLFSPLLSKLVKHAFVKPYRIGRHVKRPEKPPMYSKNVGSNIDCFKAAQLICRFPEYGEISGDKRSIGFVSSRKRLIACAVAELISSGAVDVTENGAEVKATDKVQKWLLPVCRIIGEAENGELKNLRGEQRDIARDALNDFYSRCDKDFESSELTEKHSYIQKSIKASIISYIAAAVLPAAGLLVLYLLNRDASVLIYSAVWVEIIAVYHIFRRAMSFELVTLSESGVDSLLRCGAFGRYLTDYARQDEASIEDAVSKYPYAAALGRMKELAAAAESLASTEKETIPGIFSRKVRDYISGTANAAALICGYGERF